ncbi:ABC transporter ATP-binding protein [Psychrobacillus lasiicapitis]|uniref:Dipeptide ABC transporter ATP-binding protein n=1 Tax=Psychrobacillus lasiicapitis TaxID=1636719 RepID=A0A544TBQ7_9BACI|nr:dipeptide ABC transporter ATP-binding protein [Psychrobacillus lasiicapitis]TQR14892.1 dipeptide ABC transporter ATP-binding protein [Psychrobacillus lasiicapitis]GGA20844.1 peptide ABC transporter ATP-binding protein [Psychrobacillus lasiicapitis]
MNQPLLEVKNLKTYFPIKKSLFNKKKHFVKAVDGISFQVNKGETLGIVGESGCGKSTMGRSILRLIEPTEGSIQFEGNEITALNQTDLRKLRKDMQIVFQDPFASLNPKMTVGAILGEALATHQLEQSAKERKEKVKELLAKVGLSPNHIGRYPHEFSGGQRQRIGIARAIAVNPAIIIADEPVSALDVSVQAQILNLFQDLKETLGLTYIFIAHDLSVVKHVSDRIGVMYLGKIVELSDKKQLFRQPLHPYTQALMSAVPSLDPDVKKERIILTGDVPSPSNPPTGCAFHTRCKFRRAVCEQVIPSEVVVAPGRFVNCHMYDEDYRADFN